MTASFVSIDNVSKRFPKEASFAVENISCSIPQGQIVGVVGPDGAGKTTLIRLIAGLLQPTQGKISVAHYDTIRDAEALHTLIGYMPQKFGLYEDLTVEQNLNFYAGLRGVLPQDRKATFSSILSFTGLTPFTTRLAGALSGGMKQKLGLGCALLKKPSLLLLDEPSVGVDPLSRRQLWKMVTNLLQEGISVVWSTSYLDEAEKCHTVLLLNQGKLLYQGPPQELTKTVDGRTFLINAEGESRRKTLANIIQTETVIDALIQAQHIRVVTKEKMPVLPSSYTPTPPRFEDAFIDILGGISHEPSHIADKIPKLVTQEKTMIQTEGLTKCFGTFTAVDHISLNIYPGEIFGLLGPNGAGKTTTFKMMCGLLKPTSGKAFVNGVDLGKAPSHARSYIGYMAQKFSLYDNLSVKENLEFFSGIYGLQGTHRQEAINQMIQTFSLSTILHQTSALLPLGFKQRLALACALMHSPQILFLDEPTSGVDPLTRREFWGHINGLVEKGVTVLVTTHFMDEAEYCDRIGLVYRSKLITIGSPEALKQAVQSDTMPSPTLEDAFIHLIEQYDQEAV